MLPQLEVIFKKIFFLVFVGFLIVKGTVLLTIIEYQKNGIRYIKYQDLYVWHNLFLELEMVKASLASKGKK